MKKFFQLIYLTAIGFILSSPWWVYAEEMAQAATNGENRGLYALAAGLAIAVAAFGGALGQGRVGAAAMEGIARNPQSQKIMFIPMIIVLALIESFVIFSFAVAMIIAGKI
ncbi:MAG: ATP synthase F0 subunit C [Bdellovibrionales bacterium]|nr:ATP synthase F0 subunit C [Bdellovibrionales bacterium]